MSSTARTGSARHAASDAAPQLECSALGWRPKYDFQHVLESLRAGRDFRSPLALAIGSKGYHAQVFADGPYPVLP
jgi:hypothetical protein